MDINDIKQWAQNEVNYRNTLFSDLLKSNAPMQTKNTIFTIITSEVGILHNLLTYISYQEKSNQTSKTPQSQTQTNNP